MKKRFTPTIRIILTIFIYFIAMFSCLGLFAAFHTVDRLKTDYGFLAFGNIVVGLILSGTVLLLYRFLDRGKHLQLGFQLKKKDAGFVVATIIVSTILAIGFVWNQSQEVGTVFHFDKLLNGTFLLLAAFGCIGWLFGTMQEEILNRGYYFANLHRLHFVGMFVISNLIFSATHIPTKGFHPIELLIHIVSGIGYGYVYYKSGSLTLSTIVHGFHNFLLDIFFNNDYSVTLVTFRTPLTDENKLVEQLILISIILFITHLYYGRNGAFTPAKNLAVLWDNDSSTIMKEKTSNNNGDFKF